MEGRIEQIDEWVQTEEEEVEEIMPAEMGSLRALRKKLEGGVWRGEA